MFRTKEQKQERQRSKVEKRVDSLSSAELYPWAEQAIYSIGRNLSGWQKTDNQFYLEEARIAAEALHAIVDSLNRRHTSV